MEHQHDEDLEIKNAIEKIMVDDEPDDEPDEHVNEDCELIFKKTSEAAESDGLNIQEKADLTKMLDNITAANQTMVVAAVEHLTHASCTDEDDIDPEIYTPESIYEWMKKRMTMFAQWVKSKGKQAVEWVKDFVVKASRYFESTVKWFIKKTKAIYARLRNYLLSIGNKFSVYLSSFIAWVKNSGTKLVILMKDCLVSLSTNFDLLTIGMNVLEECNLVNKHICSHVKLMASHLKKDKDDINSISNELRRIEGYSGSLGTAEKRLRDENDKTLNNAADIVKTHRTTLDNNVKSSKDYCEKLIAAKG